VYDEVVKPVEAPYPAACVESVSQGCRCYSQQATRLQVPDALCHGIVGGGFFVSWNQPLKQAVPVAGSVVPPVPVGGALAGSFGAPGAPAARSPEDVQAGSGRGRALPRVGA